jgi:UDP-glucose 4-epimerase
MRILVTGADGFLGRYVHDDLERLGHRVIGVDHRLREDARPTVLKVDVRNSQHLAVVIESLQPQAIIHLAAQASITTSRKNAVYDLDVNAGGTIRLLALAAKYGVERFVFASTSAVYAPNHSGVYHEGDWIGPQTPYGISKAAAENYCRISGVPYAILRLGNVYGPGQRPLGESILMARALAWIYWGEDFRINGDGANERDYVFVEDVSRAFILAAEVGGSMSFTVNIGTGEAHSVNEVLQRLVGIARTSGHVHGSPLDIRFWPHGPAVPGELPRVQYDVRRARKLLNWEPTTDFADGLRRTHDAWPKVKP